MRLIEATGELARLTSRFGQLSGPFLPLLDSLASPERFIIAAAEGAGAAGVDLIIGTTREEANAFFCNPSMQDPDPALVAELFSALTGQEDALEQYHRRRPGSRTVDVLSDLVTDHTFLIYRQEEIFMLRSRWVLASIALLVAFVSMRPVAANALHGCTALTDVLSREWS